LLTASLSKAKTAQFSFVKVLVRVGHVRPIDYEDVVVEVFASAAHLLVVLGLHQRLLAGQAARLVARALLWREAGNDTCRL
jgi:hypothetical protein